MKKKVDKEDIYKKYGLDIPTKVVDEAEKQIDKYLLKEQYPRAIEELEQRVKELEKENKELRPYKFMWMQIKDAYLDGDWDFDTEISLTETNTFNDMNELTKHIEGRYLK